MAIKTAAEMFGDGGGYGAAVPYSTTNPPGTGAGNRGIQFGEALTAAIANRTHYALALNDQDLNTRLAAFETGGLDAAYDNGAVGPAGGGREITKNAGAVETISTLATQYADDLANAHFRADALGDATSGGGFDFRGAAAVLPAYGVMSRVNLTPSVTYTTMGTSEAVTLNPGGAGGDVVRFAGNVHDGTNTDVGLDSLDFLEISGAGTDSGLYRVFSLGPANTDFRVRKLDGVAPTFGAGTAATSRFFVANMMSSALRAGASLRSALALSAAASEDQVLSLVGRDTEGLLGSGPVNSLAFFFQNVNGLNQYFTSFTTTGRLKSNLNSDGIGATLSRTLEWAEGGIPSVHLDKAEGGATGFHEMGVLVRDEVGATSSWAGLEARGGVTDTVAGIGAVVNGTFAAPMGRILLPDSDGVPAPPAGQLKTQWARYVQPGVTLIKILTGSGAGRYYRIATVELTALLSPDEITVTHIDGSALAALELPVVGNCTFQIIQRSVFGGKLPPIPVDSVPVGFTAPTDLTPATVLSPPTETTGDSGGRASCLFTGPVYGVAPFVVTPALPATASVDVAWAIGVDGSIYTKAEGQFGGEVRSGTNGTGGMVIESTNVAHDFKYNTPRVRTKHVNLIHGQPVGAAAWTLMRGVWSATADSDELIIPIDLPSGSVLTTVKMMVNPGAARAGANRVKMRLESQQIANWSAPAPVAVPVLTDVWGGTEPDDASTDNQIVTKTWAGITIDNANYEYWLVVIAGNDGGAHNTDVLYGVQLTYSDPGPRNF